MKKILLLCAISMLGTGIYAQKEKFYAEISLHPDESITVSLDSVKKIYDFFDKSELFQWNDKNNCEDRANAISILLDAWQIPNYKVWIFSGDFLKKKDKGLLTDKYGILWKYHVAACIPVKIDNQIKYMVLDPATTDEVKDMAFWANNVTDKQFGHYFLTPANKYLWNGGGRKMSQKSFYEGDVSTTLKRTMQGLAGFNEATDEGKDGMKTVSGKAKIQKTEDDFNVLKNNKPAF